MKQEIRFLDCIERDLKGRKKNSIKMGIVSVICFILGIMTIWSYGTITPIEKNTFLIVALIAIIVAIGPAAYSTPHILAYIDRIENRKRWNEITRRFSLNEEITLYVSKLKNHIYTRNEFALLANLFVELLPGDEIKMIITQGEESDREVKVIYILSNGTTVTEKFLCFEKDKVFDLMGILNIR